MSDVACHLRHIIVHTIGRLRAWHDYMAFWQHKRPNDVGCGMPSPPFGSIYSQTWHTIIFFGQHKQSDDVRSDKPS